MAVEEVGGVGVEEDVGGDPPDVVPVITEDPGQRALSDLGQLACCEGVGVLIPEPDQKYFFNIFNRNIFSSCRVPTCPPPWSS